MPKSAHSFLGCAFFCYHDSKKAMLVRDIALVHNRPTYKISELINRNRKRFKDGIDILDLNPLSFRRIRKNMDLTRMHGTD